MPAQRADLAQRSTQVFQTYQDFRFFKRIITAHHRYFRSGQSDLFLTAVLETCPGRLLQMPKDTPLFRAQLGHACRIGDLGEEIAGAYDATRMKPLGDRAHEGRVNPKGIPCLYLASTRDAAISEMRGGISDLVSVARFETARDLKIIDFNKNHGAFVGLFEPSADANIDDIVWATIDKAFGEPVTRVEDRADYAATQIIAEFLKINGYDGIAYKSQFDAEGFNVALFDLDAAQQTECHLFRITKVKTEFDGPWDGYSSKI